MRLFDSHAHYNDNRFDAEYPGGMEKAIADAFDAGVIGFINVGTNPDNSRTSLSIAEKYPHVYAAAGLHPEDAGDYPKESLNRILDEIRELLTAPKIVALGEIGLDYHWDTDRHIQHTVFDAQLALAKELNLPVIVHSREAHGDTLAMIQAHPGVTGVMHAYSGSAEMVREYVKLGWYISFGGPVTFKTAEKVRDACRAVPEDRLLVETDCPYLAPVPHRGKINSSALMHYTLEAMAKARGVDPEALAYATVSNAERLFRISLQ